MCSNTQRKVYRFVMSVHLSSRLYSICIPITIRHNDLSNDIVPLVSVFELQEVSGLRILLKVLFSEDSILVGYFFVFVFVSYLSVCFCLKLKWNS